MTENILQILERLAAGEIDVEALLTAYGGRQWYLPTVNRSKARARYVAICAYPSRDYKVVAKAFKCSFGVVYRAWDWERRTGKV